MMTKLFLWQLKWQKKGELKGHPQKLFTLCRPQKSLKLFWRSSSVTATLARHRFDFKT